MDSGRARLAPSIASMSRKGMPPQWSPWICVNTIASIVLWSMPSLFRATQLYAPKSMTNRKPGESTKMQVWKRPPDPNASPDPTKVTLTDIAFSVGCAVGLTHPLYFYDTRNMKTTNAVSLLAALAQETRLEIFRALIQAGRGGRAAGAIGEAVGAPASTLSFHLKELSAAGLISSRQDGRFIYYSANYAAMSEL